MTKIRVTASRQSHSWMPGSGWFTSSEASRTSGREREEQEGLGTPHPVGPAQGLHRGFRARQKYRCLIPGAELAWPSARWAPVSCWGSAPSTSRGTRGGSRQPWRLSGAADPAGPALGILRQPHPIPQAPSSDAGPGPSLRGRHQSPGSPPHRWPEDPSPPPSCWVTDPHTSPHAPPSARLTPTAGPPEALCLP